MRINLTIASLTLLLVTASVARAETQLAPSLRYVDTKQASHTALVIDTRALAACQQHSIAGAHCLPASDLLGPNGALPGFADIFWALGTANINADNTVLVTGDQARARDFVAGLLYLCGQARVQILTVSIDNVLQQKHWPAGAGLARSNLRQSVYNATMRDKLIVLPTELAQALARHDSVVPVDGRNLSTPRVNDEYLAEHIPGAMQLPQANSNHISSHLRLPDVSEKTPGSNASSAPAKHRYFVAYAYKPLDSIALFTRLRAGEVDPHIDIRVMPAGWQGWIHSRRIANIRKGEKQWI
jgi:thiosulfate/3-mercaptopyruvate sulfurtransferase